MAYQNREKKGGMGKLVLHFTEKEDNLNKKRKRLYRVLAPHLTDSVKPLQNRNTNHILFTQARVG